MKHLYKFELDPSFKKQRLTLGNIISSGIDCDLLTEEKASNLEGIQNLLDEIADQAHDNHGLDVLNCENEEIYATN